MSTTITPFTAKAVALNEKTVVLKYRICETLFPYTLDAQRQIISFCTMHPNYLHEKTHKCVECSRICYFESLFDMPVKFPWTVSDMGLNYFMIIRDSVLCLVFKSGVVTDEFVTVCNECIRSDKFHVCRSYVYQ